MMMMARLVVYPLFGVIGGFVGAKADLVVSGVLVGLAAAALASTTLRMALRAH